MTVADDPDRHKAVRRLVNEVRLILLEDWDPLYVGGNPALADEYDFVLGKVMAGLTDNPSLEGVVGLLAKLEEEDLGLPTPRPDLCGAAANKLRSLRAANAHWPDYPGNEAG